MLANRYKIISELGFGGMGTVYKVSDSLNENNFYALKMLREGNFGVNRFKREFSRIAKLRHENIVQVYDFGSFNEQNTDKYFFVMELLEGKSLKEIEISDLTQVYKIITKVCLALSYVHSRQIIHCDLKPANIFVTNSNEIKLMDFGLAESFDFENKGKISGTIAYIPPERIKGLSLDQRSDLYSLGVIFYELLTNKNPFDISSVFGLLRQQLNTFPQTPKIFNKNIPDKVEKIVLKLLEKEPSKRFLNALEVLQELSQVMDFSVELQEKQETNLETLTNSSAFCGRETEFALVKAELEKNQTYFCELVGETGSGKSRFLSEVKFFAQLQDFKVVFCDASEQLNSPFSTLSVVLERFLRFFDKTKIDLLSEKFGKVLGKILPAFPKVSVELSHFEEEKLLVEAVNFIFNTFEKKFLILLENFDLCDFQSLDLIKKISVNNTNCKFLASSVTPKLEKNRIFLKGLAENEVEKILFSIFGDQFLTPKISEKIYKATDGNPLFVLETIKLLVRNDVFFRKNFSWFVDFEKFGSFKFSKRLEGIFSKKIQDFSETESKILIWFSVLNKPAKAEDILFLSGLETEMFWETLGKLVFSGILKESEKSYKITQEELHRLLYNNLNLMEKREKHIKITFYFEQKKYSEEEIFYHASKGMVFEKMLFYSLSLANNYFQARFFDDSIKLYKISLETLAFFEPEKALEIIKIWIEKRVTQSNKIILSNWVETLKTFEQKQALIFAKMLIKKFIAMMVLELGNQKEALETYFEILKTAQELDENKQIGGIFSDIAGIYLEQNDLEKAENFFEKAFKTYEKIAFQGGQMLVLNNLGAVYLRRNNYTKVLECFGKSLELAKKLQNKYFQAVTLVNIAEVLVEFSNDCTQSFANLEQALEIAAEIKRPDLEFLALLAKTKLHFQLGNAKEIGFCFEELEKTEAQTPYERFVFLQLKAEKLFFQGETEKAKELCEETIKLGTEKGFDTNESKILLGKIIPDKDEKLKLFNEVFENCAKIQNRILEVSVLCEIAKINNNIKLIDKVYSFGISLKNDAVQVKALVAYGFCYFVGKDFELALENLNLAIEGTKFKTLELEILELKFRIFKLTNNQTKLEETGKKLISVAEIFGNKTLRNFVEENLKNESVGSVASSNLGKLLEVISAVNTTKNIDELLALIIDKTLEVTSAERGFLMMKNESGELEFAVARNFNREDLREGSLEISQTTVNQVFKTGKSVFADNIPKDEILSKQGSILDLDLKVILCVPLKFKEQVLGVIYVDSKFSAGILQENQLKLMEAFASQSAIAIENARLYSLLENENKTLKKQLQERFRFGKIIGKSQKMLEVYEKIEVLAQRNITVMVNGETGTGKELVAKAIHYESKRKAKPLVILNCAALPETLLESELFGYEKGAFTGATERKKGKFELANEGSIFLDEIGDMPLLTQAKILRVIQEKKFYRLGGEKEIEVDVRIIAATHKNLLETVEKGTFRQDLFYRLNIAKIELPSLRERTEDIPLLVNYFLEKFKKDYEFLRLEITKEALNKLVNYAWPGNIRELENSLEQMAIFSKTGILDVKDLAFDFLETESKVQKTDLDFGKVRSYKDIKKAQKDFSDKLQREFFSKLLEKNDGNVAKTAQAAKIARPQLHLILKELGIK